MFDLRKLEAYPVYLILTGASSLFFALIFTVNLVYQATVAGLNPLQLVLVGTVLELTAFLCEVPTGVVADVYSRRLSVIIGVFLIGLGFVVEGLFPRFEAILLAQVIWGIGATFMSGAEQAWIADEVGEARAGRAFMRGAQVGQLAGLVGIGASALLASTQMNLPIVLGGALYMVLGLFLLLFMPERHFTPAPPEARSSWKTMGDTLRSGGRLVRRRPVLLTILGIGAVYGLFSEGFDRLWTVHLLQGFTLPALGRFEPVVWFGIIRAVSSLLSVVATEAARRRLDTTNHVGVARFLLGLDVLIVASIIVFGLAGNFAVALVALWATQILRSTSGPIFTAWLNQHVDSRVRATVFSMHAQMNALGQIAGGPVVGAIGTVYSLRAAITLTGVVLSPVLGLYARAIRRGDDQGVALPEEAPASVPG